MTISENSNTDAPDSNTSLKRSSKHDSKRQLGSLQEPTAEITTHTGPARDRRFWMILFILCLSSFMAILELASTATALPIIIQDLKGEQFVWIGSAYALTASAFLPMSGGLAQAFGRRVVMQTTLLAFAVGSAVCGAAPSLNVLIAGRAIQGIGGGGILSLSGVVLSDLVSLQERGKFNALLGISWTLGSTVGPIIGGALATHNQWRWLFYLNIPICGITSFLVAIFFRLRTPPGSFREKIARIDHIGNLIIIASTTACVIGLTWGGVQFTWSSPKVLVPLIVGCAGIVGFVVYESLVATYPMMPYILFSNSTSFSAYFQNFMMGLTQFIVTYYLPVYFQACRDASPTRSGIDILCYGILCSIFTLAGGISVKATGRYRPQLWFGWVVFIIGVGLLATLNADTNGSAVQGFEAIAAIGSGVIITATVFPVLAPLPIKTNTQAMSTFVFARNFAQVWGVTIGGTVLQNELKRRLPAEFTAEFPEGVQIAYQAIPLIRNLQQPLKDQVRDAFAGSLRNVWLVDTGLIGLGLLSCFLLRHYALHTYTDKDWGKEDDDDSHMEHSMAPVPPA